MYTFAKFAAEDISDAEAPLKELAALIRTRQIPELLTQLESEDIFRKFPDVKGLLHLFGINLRYLGEVADQVEVEGVKIILERDGIARAARRVMNGYMNSTSNFHISAVIAHVLNCILDLGAVNEEEKKGGKRRKKRKGAQSKAVNLI